MRTPPRHLINFAHIEAVPAQVLRGRDNASARALANADWLLRRKRDGRYLAVVQAGRLRALLPDALSREIGRMPIAALLQRLVHESSCVQRRELPLHTLRKALAKIGLTEDEGHARGLPTVAEPACLAFAGFDRYRRPLWLEAAAARAWRRMRAAAAREGVTLEAISGYRSHAYQLGIFHRKLASGQTLKEILAVNAPPGFSEHHSGKALDIGTPGEPPAEESFETTPAFAWLSERGRDFGFVMSYPRGNPHGIVYEPWHWCFKA